MRFEEAGGRSRARVLFEGSSVMQVDSVVRDVSEGLRQAVSAVTLVLRNWRRLLGPAVLMALLLALMIWRGAGWAAAASPLQVVLDPAFIAMLLVTGAVLVWLWWSGWELAHGSGLPKPRPVAFAGAIVLLALTFVGVTVGLAAVAAVVSLAVVYGMQAMGLSGLSPDLMDQCGDLLAWLAMMMLMARLFLVLPAAMDGQAGVLGASWRLTAGVWIICATLLLATGATADLIDWVLAAAFGGSTAVPLPALKASGLTISFGMGFGLASLLAIPVIAVASTRIWLERKSALDEPDETYGQVPDLVG
jgi:hypothetical protein